LVKSIIISVSAIVSGLLFTKVANSTSEKALNWAVVSIFVIVGILTTFLGKGGGRHWRLYWQGDFDEPSSLFWHCDQLDSPHEEHCWSFGTDPWHRHC